MIGETLFMDQIWVNLEEYVNAPHFTLSNKKKVRYSNEKKSSSIYKGKRGLKGKWNKYFTYWKVGMLKREIIIIIISTNF